MDWSGAVNTRVISAGAEITRSRFDRTFKADAVVKAGRYGHNFNCQVLLEPWGGRC
jgi:hypothetical protein